MRVQTIKPSRDRIYEKPALIDRFVRENPRELNAEDLELARGYKNFKKGMFYIYKTLKKHAVFVDDDRAYAVLALADPINQVLGGMRLPVAVNAVLLPFKDKIIYDGMLSSYNIYFGGGIKSTLKLKYEKVTAQYGLIESLPISAAVKNQSFDAADKLELYMKTAASRDRYYYEIENLVEKNPGLQNLYTHLWGKVNARALKKRLKEAGVKGYHFAVYFDTVLTSAKTKAATEKQATAMLGKGKAEGVYYFKL